MRKYILYNFSTKKLFPTFSAIVDCFLGDLYHNKYCTRVYLFVFDNATVHNGNYYLPHMRAPAHKLFPTFWRLKRVGGCHKKANSCLGRQTLAV